MVQIGRLISRLTSLTSTIGSLFVILLILHITLDVALRFIFNKPLSATILYVSLFYMSAITFLALGSVEEKNAHISVEVVTSLLPSRLVRILSGFSMFLTILVTGMLTIRTWQEAAAKYKLGAFTMDSGVRISTWESYFFLPVGFGLMLLVVIYKFICHVTGARSGFVSEHSQGGLAQDGQQETPS